MPGAHRVFAVGAYGSERSCAAARSSSTRSPSSAAPRARPTAWPRSMSGSSRRPAARTRCASRVARCCRRRSAATLRRQPGRPALDVLQGDPARCATSPSVSARCGRSGPRPRSRSPSSRRTSASRTAASGDGQQRVRTGSRDAGPRPGVDGRPPADLRRASCGRRRRHPHRCNPFGQAIAEPVVGSPLFDANGRRPGHRAIRPVRDDRPADVRLNIGMNSQLPTDGAVILAWARARRCRSRSSGVAPPDRQRRSTTCRPSRDRGLTTFSSDLLRSTVVDADAMFFGKAADNMNFGQGQRHARVSADRVRGNDRADRADHRARLRGRRRGRGRAARRSKPLDRRSRSPAAIR